ncbi:DUF1642 domain-containing protein [Lactiplantibacillus plantarum]|uniref:DUF1642 domain-containing protein n=1 Tax=Lactiplantibacillus plantarum TaxID=1590 RepID=UPI000933B41D|nr:DUF1642 domain-containing protein [Lactiplantibacillus plantarum]
MTKIYRKTGTIKAEQFDGSNEMVERYDMGFQLAPNGKSGAIIKTLEGDLLVHVGDWIATGANGEHWPIADDVFKKTYAELPVIPKAVAAWIEKCKHDGIAIASAMDERQLNKKVSDYFRTYYTRDQWIKLQDDFARAWLDGYQVEEDE